MKKLLSLILTGALLLGLSLPAAAEEVKASTLRLEKTEGTVTLTNQNGRTLTLRDDMKLYSGYNLTTKAASYAYVSLDASKAIKLDASTSAMVRKSGRQLEVLVSSGKIFFNVTVPLEEDETLEVRTSTMVTGIRGTAGVVDCVDEETSILYLLDGEVTLTSTDPATGEVKEVTVTPGQTAVASKSVTPDGAPAQTVTVTELKAEELPGFAAKAIAESPALQEKITAQTTLDVPAIVEKAAENLAKEQTAQKQAEKAAEAEKAKQEENKKVEHLPGPSQAPSKDKDDGGGSVTPTPSPTPSPSPSPLPSPDPSPSVPPSPPPSPGPVTKTLSGSDVTAQKLDDALKSSDVVKLASDVQLTIESGKKVTVPVNKTLVLLSSQLTRSNSASSMTVASGGELAVSGTLVISPGAELTSSGTVDVSTRLENNGSLTLTGGSFTASGHIINNGAMLYNDSHNIVLNITHVLQLGPNGYLCPTGIDDPLKTVSITDGTAAITTTDAKISWPDVLNTPNVTVRAENLNTVVSLVKSLAPVNFLGRYKIEMESNSFLRDDLGISDKLELFLGKNTLNAKGNSIQLLENSELTLSGSLDEGNVTASLNFNGNAALIVSNTAKANFTYVNLSNPTGAVVACSGTATYRSGTISGIFALNSGVLEVVKEFGMTIGSGGTLTVSSGATVTGNGTINNYGKIKNKGTINLNSNFTNGSNTNSSALLHNDGGTLNIVNNNSSSDPNTFINYANYVSTSGIWNNSGKVQFNGGCFLIPNEYALGITEVTGGNLNTAALKSSLSSSLQPPKLYYKDLNDIPKMLAVVNGPKEYTLMLLPYSGNINPTQPSNFVIESGQNVTLDLYDIQLDLGGNTIQIENGGSLTIKDTANGAGTITSTGTTITLVDTAKLTIANGVVKKTGTTGFAIELNISAVLTISGGKVVAPAGTPEAGQFIFSTSTFLIGYNVTVNDNVCTVTPYPVPDP